MTMRKVLGPIALALAGLVIAGPAGAVNAFPDVPPWHWAYPALIKDRDAGLIIGYPTAPADLVKNSLFQIYDGFVHGRAAGARDWVERFTYSRPAAWPAPLEHSPLAFFSLDPIAATVTGDTAVATFTATTTVREGGGERTLRASMRVRLRLIDGDWKADYEMLAAGSPLFR